MTAFFLFDTKETGNEAVALSLATVFSTMKVIQNTSRATFLSATFSTMSLTSKELSFTSIYAEVAV